MKLTKTEEENVFLFHDALDIEEENVEVKEEGKKVEVKEESTEEVKEEKVEAKDGEEVVDKV